MMKSMLAFSIPQASSLIPEVEKVSLPSSGALQLTLDQLFFKYIYNKACIPVTFNLLPADIEYWLPPNSGFLMSDLSQASEFLPQLSPKNGFDLIVMDPPYLNISAQRSKAYKMEDLYSLFQLPVSKLINPTSGMVAVWITNRPKVRRFVVDKLFNSWNISLVAEWAWVKITTTGEPVLAFDSKHKKPYELILIGSKATSSIPHRHVLASVPCKIHSRKPPIFDLIAPFLQKNKEDCLYLELFGRSLYPNTLTWGNEPIKFQASMPYC
ncbi:hypothetical protein DSO57_1015876 [Entomophthora muscae]|uniref:Uncharacterized protein n=1 Tax=Entomophthora muscae TaxID=34485 RepID=A0ACC2RJQ5_9FUNG|nr:hypothetical protein DSO57_1015876 [Entomophthora muscae]